jgi:hypothetical protein
MLLEVFQYHNDQFGELVNADECAEGTLKKFKSAYTSLAAFIKWKYNKLDYPIAKLSYQFITDYEFYLKTVQKIQHNHLRVLKFSPALPYVFTEHGAVMLASVLNSEVAIRVNVQIIRIFARMREILLTNKDILLKVEQLERKVSSHDENIQLIFKYFRELLGQQNLPRRKIGFKSNDDD